MPSDSPDHADQAAGLRRIIPIDMDAFYASVEQRDDPAIRGLPVAVGGSSGRGVRSAMPSLQAARRCPDLIFRPPRFEVSRQVSWQIRAIFRG